MQSCYISYIFIYWPTLGRASPSGRNWGNPLLPKILAFPPMSNPVFCPINVVFVIFMQLLAILRRLYPHKSNSLRKPCYVSFPNQGNFSCRCSFIIRKLKTQLEIAYYHGKSTENIDNVSDFRRIIFLGVI